MNETAIIYALSLISGIGNKTLHHLITHFGSAEAVWQADEKSLLAINGMGEKTVTTFIAERNSISPEKEWEKIVSQNPEINLLAFTDENYPRLLKEIPDAPAILYTRGNYAWEEKPMMAIVGSRKFTNYGEQATYRFATDLARAGFVVVSGLALGIDSIAHKAALEAGSETLAVLGGGVDDNAIYPRSHLSLAKAIMHSGALISEYSPGTQVTEGTFPARNRIVAGMCCGTLIIEASERSGALITARLALDYNREVFAVPGSIFSPNSLGTNSLIKSGAKTVMSVQDILEELPIAGKNKFSEENNSRDPNISLSEEEEKIFQILSHEPLHVDKIIKAARLETSSVISTLTMLEIKALAKNIGGMNYIKI